MQMATRQHAALARADDAAAAEKNPPSRSLAHGSRSNASTEHAVSTPLHHIAHGSRSNTSTRCGGSASCDGPVPVYGSR